MKKEGEQGSIAKRWSRRTGRNVEGRIEFRALYMPERKGVLNITDEHPRSWHAKAKRFASELSSAR